MDANTGMIILYVIMGFFGFVTIVCGLAFYIFWRRRKLIFTNFLSDTGQWEKKAWMPDKLDKTFYYDGCAYNYDIRKCTRDRINRPIAHYYKGNPEQQIFDFNKTNKKLVINTQEITMKDFVTLMLTKVIRDIFQDDEVMNWLMIIAGLVVCFGIAIIIVVLTHNVKTVSLNNDNQTISIIAEGVKQAIKSGIPQ